ncbi:hypothetical protein BT69DRAFT_1348041 [Atractiella rhizophila]|nr:hypothetical protein BT69DRAFT_1348041 [Atractiella rhizophila]
MLITRCALYISISHQSKKKLDKWEKAKREDEALHQASHTRTRTEFIISPLDQESSQDSSPVFPLDIPVTTFDDPRPFYMLPGLHVSEHELHEFWEGAEDILESEGSSDVGEDLLETFYEMEMEVGCQWDSSVDRPASFTGHQKPVCVESLDPENMPWYPYANEAEALSDLILNLPRHPVSEAERQIWWWMISELTTSTGAPLSLPSRNRLNQLHHDFLEQGVGTRSIEYRGHRGNVFYVNDIGSLLQKELANPLVANHLRTLPEDTSDTLKEMWQAEKWKKDLSADLLTPSIRLSDIHTISTTPLKPFVSSQGAYFPTLWAKGRYAGKMSRLNGEVRWIVESEEVEVDVKEFVGTAEELYELNGISISGQFIPVHPPLNPIRQKARGCRSVVVPIVLYGDDSSGNISKQWNKHLSFYMTLAGLPNRLQNQEYNIHFLATSNIAPALEILEGIVQQLQHIWQDGLFTYDAANHEEIHIQALVLLFEGDNPMQAEICSTGSLASLVFCRECDAGAESKAEAQTASGLDTFMKSGKLRDPLTTVSTSKEQHQSATHLRQKHRIETVQRQTGIKDNVVSFFIEQLQDLASTLESSDHTTEQIMEQLKLKYDEQLSHPFTHNPIFHLVGLNIHQDTPFEILHGVLLGFVKYLWRDIIGRLSNEQKTKVAQRLSACDTSGLDFGDVNGDSLIQFARSLVGKDFKIIMQIGLFALHDCLDPFQLDVWRTLTQLGRLLWRPVIHNLQVYCDHLKRIIDHFLNSVALLNPQGFNNSKFHLLVHLPEHIKRFGVPINFATEKFESYNGVMRLRSVHSNRQAPSRDIARAFASYHRVRHIFSGGWWKSVDGRWIRASANVRHLFFHKERIRQLLGLNIDPLDLDGRKTASAGQVRPISVTATKSAPPSIARTVLPPEEAQRYRRGAALNLQNNEEVGRDDWILHELEAAQQLILFISQVIEVGAVHGKPIIIGHSYAVTGFHPGLLMPILQKWSSQPRLIPFSAIRSPVNVQHDCAFAGCVADESIPLRQERRNSSRQKSVIRHRHEKEPDRWILNTAAFRNAMVLDHFVPLPEVEDRQEVIKRALERQRTVQEEQRQQATARQSKMRQTIAAIDISQFRYTQPDFNPSQLLVVEIKALLQHFGIQYSSKATKSELLELLTSNLKSGTTNVM